MAYIGRRQRLCVCGVKGGRRGEGLLFSVKLSERLTKTRMPLKVSPALLPDAAQDCLLSAASNDTFQIFNTWGNFSFNLSVFRLQTVFPSKKKKRAPPPNRIFFPPPVKKYLSWIPLFSCNSPSSCFHCKRLSTVCLIYLSSVGGTGAPARHSWTRRRVVVGGGFQRGRRSLSSPSSGDSRWEVNSANTPGTGRHTPINACFAGEHRKK